MEILASTATRRDGKRKDTMRYTREVIVPRILNSKSTVAVSCKQGGARRKERETHLVCAYTKVLRKFDLIIKPRFNGNTTNESFLPYHHPKKTNMETKRITKRKPLFQEEQQIDMMHLSNGKLNRQT